VIEVTARPSPLADLQGLIAHLEPEVCAQAYLDWFETVLDTPPASGQAFEGGLLYRPRRFHHRLSA
jgi:hypothetical protein